MQLTSYFLVTKRLLFKRSSSSLKSMVIAIALSLVPLTIAMEVADAMEDGIISRSIETDSYHLRAVALLGAGYEEALEVAEQLKAADDRVIFSTVEGRAIGVAFNQYGRTSVQLRGVAGDFYVDDAGMRRYLAIDSGAVVLGPEDVLVGRQIAGRLNLAVGEQLRLLSASWQDGEYRPQITSFTVQGIFSTGYQELDRTWLFINREALFELFTPDEISTLVGLKVLNPFENIHEISANLNCVTPLAWLVYSWRVLNAQQLASLATTKVLLFFILGLIVLVAVVNSTGSVYIFYLQNRRDIAIFKALGITSQQLKWLLLGPASLAGLLGALLGLTIGSILAVNINTIIRLIEILAILFNREVDFSFYLETIPVSLSLPRLLLIALLVTLLAAITAYLPLRKASKTKPLAILGRM